MYQFNQYVIHLVFDIKFPLIDLKKKTNLQHF